jgi:Peptidase_C39 like family
MSIIITALLIVVMLLIIFSLVFSAWHEYKRHKQKQTAQSLPSHPLDRHVTAILHLQDGVVVSVEKPNQTFTLSSSWYSRRRTLVSLGFVVMILLALFIQGGLAGGPLRSLTQGVSFSFLVSQSTTNADDVQVSSHAAPLTASLRLVRVDSADRNQYYNDYQWQVWSYSSCSGIAMEMAMNAYGRHFIAADVLQKELDLGVWSVQLGLLREDGISMTAATFGFNTSYGHSRSLQDIINISNSGSPVIVSVRDATYFPGGHIFVIRGGDSQYVYVADSSPANFTRMSRSMFLSMWSTFSAVLTPN